MALLFVFLATWFFLAHLLSSLYVVFVVFVTLVNVGGFMHFWGLTIETATSIFLTISMGLSVDYSAHIAHAFMVTQGPSRNERMKKVRIKSLSLRMINAVLFHRPYPTSALPSLTAASQRSSRSPCSGSPLPTCLSASSRCFSLLSSSDFSTASSSFQRCSVSSVPRQCPSPAGGWPPSSPSTTKCTLSSGQSPRGPRGSTRREVVNYLDTSYFNFN